jgi:streptothricin acetyltransferase
MLPKWAGKTDFSFETDSMVVEPFDATPLRLEPLPPRRKTYGRDDALYESAEETDRMFLLWRERGEPRRLYRCEPGMERLRRNR